MHLFHLLILFLQVDRLEVTSRGFPVHLRVATDRFEFYNMIFIDVVFLLRFWHFI